MNPAPAEGRWRRAVRGVLSLWQREERLRFLVIGLYNTGFSILAFAGLYALLHRHLHYLVLLVLTHVLAVTNAFLGHKYLTFRVEGRMLADYLRFNLAYLGALAFGLAAMPLLVEVLGLHPLTSQVILNVLNVVGSFFLHKYVSFRRA